MFQVHLQEAGEFLVERASLIWERSWHCYRARATTGHLCHCCCCYLLLIQQSQDWQTHGNAEQSPFLAITHQAAFQLRFVSLRSPDEHEIRLELLSEPRLQLQQGLSKNSIFVCKNNQVWPESPWERMTAKPYRDTEHTKSWSGTSNYKLFGWKSQECNSSDNIFNRNNPQA